MFWQNQTIVRLTTQLISAVNALLRVKTHVKKLAKTLLGLSIYLFFISMAQAAMVEFNSSGGTSSTNGLHFYIDESTQLQVRRLNNTGQVYDPASIAPNTNLDNGIFLRANNSIYGPSNFTYTPSGGAFGTRSITATSPANPASSGDQQTSTHSFRVPSGPQVTILWKYNIPYDFITAEVTLVIPTGYPVSTSNPVRYYHVIDTYLGGSDFGCGVKFTDSNGKLVVGTYPPSGSTCPSSTSVPSGISVVESFRERSGLGFANYCAASWDSFWQTSTNNCFIGQTNDLSNKITTVYEDTGIGIEYKFTSTGTYTFSYDFVVGSTAVPAYDHLEIRHPGTSSLCPATLTVLACTSTTVPCPTANIVNTGTLTGSVKNTPNTPSITYTPASFTLGSSATTASVVLQGSAAGTYTLSGTGLSSTPLNGTKCWNTATSTASCSFIVTSSPCVSNFECMETGLSYNNLISSPSARNPLYTELAGTGFKFDVIALQSSGAIASGYTASTGVTVELFDDSASPQPACSAYTSPIASQAITFATGDAGRKTLATNLTVANAYKKLRCRVRDTNVSIFGCSSDNFAVRPSNFTVSSSNANADATGTNTTATPRLAAGSNFALTASTGLSGYNGTPSIDNTKLAAHAGAVLIGALTGNFNAASAGSATGAAFNYSEVGYFRFDANGIFDDSFTAIDSAVGDCTIGFTASGSKYGCSFGNTSATNYFGRFIPDHFDTVVTQGCSTGGFTYSAQPFNTQITARNSNGGITQNYDNAASFSKNLALSDANAVTTGSLASASVAASTFSAGIANATPSFNFTTAKTAPATIKLHALDLDSVASSTTEGTATIRSGRLRLQNAYGSELLPLPIPLEAQYWNGSSYIRNQQDSCTTVTASSITMSNYKLNLTDSPSCETQLGYTSGTGTLANGVSRLLRLSKPGAGNNGSVDLSINLNAASGNTCNAATRSSATSAALPWFGANPLSRATFGIYKTPVIYLRENF